VTDEVRAAWVLLTREEAAARVVPEVHAPNAVRYLLVRDRRLDYAGRFQPATWGVYEARDHEQHRAR